MALIVLIAHDSRQTHCREGGLLGQDLAQCLTGCLNDLLLLVLLDLQQGTEQLVSVLGLMLLLQTEAGSLQPCDALWLIEDRHVEGYSERENLDPCHFPEVAALLFVVHPDHVCKGVFAQSNESLPSVHKCSHNFYIQMKSNPLRMLVLKMSLALSAEYLINVLMT